MPGRTSRSRAFSAGATLAQARDRALELLAYLGVERRRDAMPGELSGGEAQRVAIARALANDPRIILADEPTAALNSQRAGIVMDMLRKVATERRTAVIVVTHDEKIFNRFDHIYSLRDGALEVPSTTKPREPDLIDVKDAGLNAAKVVAYATNSKGEAMHDWPEMTKELSAQLRNLRGGAPDVMKAFAGIAQVGDGREGARCEDEGAHRTRHCGRGAMRRLHRLPRQGGGASMALRVRR